MSQRYLAGGMITLPERVVTGGGGFGAQDVLTRCVVCRSAGFGGWAATLAGVVFTEVGDCD